MRVYKSIEDCQLFLTKNRKRHFSWDIEHRGVVPELHECDFRSAHGEPTSCSEPLQKIDNRVVVQLPVSKNFRERHDNVRTEVSEVSVVE